MRPKFALTSCAFSGHFCSRFSVLSAKYTHVCWSSQAIFSHAALGYGRTTGSAYIGSRLWRRVSERFHRIGLVDTVVPTGSSSIGVLH